MPDPVNNCLQLPPRPDAGEPCLNNTTYAIVSVCVNGMPTLDWLDVEEIGGGGMLRAAQAGCGGGGCAKLKLLEIAEKAGWTSEEVIKALKALG